MEVKPPQSKRREATWGRLGVPFPECPAALAAALDGQPPLVLLSDSRVGKEPRKWKRASLSLPHTLHEEKSRSPTSSVYI